MKKILILIILLIIFIQINNYLNYENYYTFFRPFGKKKNIILNTNKNNFIYDKIIFITFNELNYYFKNLLYYLIQLFHLIIMKV